MSSDDEDSLIKEVGPLPSLPQMQVPSVTGIPDSEPEDGVSLEDKRAELVARIQELSGTLKYMGDGHPLRIETAVKLESMRQILKKMTEFTES